MEPGFNSEYQAQAALERAFSKGELVIPAPVFAELLACPGRDQKFLEQFCRDTGITIDWVATREIWITAGLAFQAYAARQKAQRNAQPRRILADFLIGAYALEKADRLLTLDKGLYHTAFPGLHLESF